MTQKREREDQDSSSEMAINEADLERILDRAGDKFAAKLDTRLQNLEQRLEDNKISAVKACFEEWILGLKWEFDDAVKSESSAQFSVGSA